MNRGWVRASRAVVFRVVLYCDVESFMRFFGVSGVSCELIYRTIDSARREGWSNSMLAESAHTETPQIIAITILLLILQTATRLIYLDQLFSISTSESIVRSTTSGQVLNSGRPRTSRAGVQSILAMGPKSFSTSGSLGRRLAISGRTFWRCLMACEMGRRRREEVKESTSYS